ncbi:MAG: hypothetical protein AB1898_30525 [Acidobacteriota bacterium]
MHSKTDRHDLDLERLLSGPSTETEPGHSEREKQWQDFKHTLQVTKESQDLLDTHLASATALSLYIALQNSPELVRHRMAIEVAAKGSALKAALHLDDAAFSAISSEEKYVQLLELNMASPNAVFSEALPPADLCHLKRAAEQVKSYLSEGRLTPEEADAAQQSFQRAIRTGFRYIQNRWEAITRRRLDVSDYPPPLSELLERRAPLPSVSSWSYHRYGEEARAMRQAAYTKGCSTEHLNHTAAQSTNSLSTLPQNPTHNRTEHPSSALAAQPTDLCPTPGAEVEGSPPISHICNARHLMQASGQTTLATPTGTEPRYTFPQQLRRAEDIFYDYSILIPVEVECGPCRNEYAEEHRSLLAIRVLVGKGNAVLQFLRSLGIAGALGEYPAPNPADAPVPVVQELGSLLARAASLAPSASTLAFIDLRRDCRELAGVLRLVARTEIWMPPPVSDFDALAAQLRTAADNLVASNPTRRIPTTKDAGTDARTRHVLESPAASLPNADETNYATTSEGWIYRNPTQYHELRSYLIKLQADLYPKITSLKTKAVEVAGAIQNASLGYADYSAQFQKMAAGLVNDTSYVLSIILDTIAELLQLPRRLALPGSKRLALQLIFRQYWFTEGYAQGKLVGYKTLIPNEKETIRRRTFVKTTSETTTAREFVSARQEDYSLTQRQTADVMKEATNNFNFTTNSSGHFDVGVWGGDAAVGMTLDLAKTSKAAQSSIAESIMKSSVSFNEKREVKIRELRETEDVREVTTEIHNSNQEITANYFYYQLLRQYCVITQLYDMKPVLLRSRDIPSPAEVDEKWVSRYIHLLIRALPTQLSVDAQEVVDEIDLLSRSLMRRRAEMNQLKEDLDAFIEQGAPSDAEELSRWREERRARENQVSDARNEYISSEQAHSRARSRIDRVISHLRENICYYIQFIWQGSFRTDHEMVLRQDHFCGYPLPQVTQGLNLLGYNGNEEIYLFTGKSAALFQALVTNMATGRELIGAAPELGKDWDNVLEQLEHHFQEGTESLIERLMALGFFKDPALLDELFTKRRVQVAEDALVVEAMPGQVPLLEAFQMAHRMLDVERACLENTHLRERISDRPWQNDGDDSYSVRRYDGAVPPQRETVEK